MRNISCSLTTPQVRARTKTVTRRLGWETLKAGDRLQLCEKCMGRKAGEPLVRLATVEVLRAEREPLGALIRDRIYGDSEAVKEGFPELNGPEFVAFFLSTHPKDKDRKPTGPWTVVTRIEWRYLD